MTRITVAPNELAIKALRCPDDRPRMVVHLEGHGNAGLKLYVERSGTKSWYYRARVMGSGSREMPLGRWPDVSIAAARQRKADAVASLPRAGSSMRATADPEPVGSGSAKYFPRSYPRAFAPDYSQAIPVIWGRRQTSLADPIGSCAADAARPALRPVERAPDVTISSASEGASAEKKSAQWANRRVPWPVVQSRMKRGRLVAC